MPVFRIHRLVTAEFEAARQWYAERSPLAASNFAQRFGAALARILGHPRSHSPWRALFRRVRLPRFPYLIVFHTDRKFTSVLALVHERREPTGVLHELRQRFVRFT